ncbi:hypothetical protein [Legionella israelensis]|uniref:Uncharacterized protein n=1 Tax=Legionella israelensis TaxID=454 RepID=A0A0W0V1H3_9GAMM|nr:hypothetical protein [Legionella israelensis]KTD13979.1 hypothetical protein Lisr_2755 [Legionella israelensis]QBS09638.1 hypothetical protein E4T55_07050 [Legionella israelensis]SCY25391.1 hypothetical protein SAMN02746069_01788 [Legionella israelensis DSM 19235]STX60569.1 Uncharacterised protein [Legionella israelensis]
MGRWLKIVDDMPQSKPTKLTQHPSVGFVSTTSEVFHKNMNEKIDLIGFVNGCLKGFPIDAQQVIDGLLSLEDEQDIINGNVPAESLRLHIELWLKADKPHYSGK